MPMTAFIGVRISWLIVARNALLASFAVSACARASLRLREELRVANRDADAGGHRGEQTLVGWREAAFLAGALHADHADRLAAHRDRHAQVGLGLHADLRRADRLCRIVDRD